jgi:hypothetical protein
MPAISGVHIDIRETDNLDAVEALCRQLEVKEVN